MNDSIANAGATPVASCSSARKPSSVSFCMPQSVWWISITSRVPSRRWEIASERITSSVITPPALRRTCASPSASPSAAKTSSRESMHVTIASARLGRRSRWLLGSAPAKSALLASSSSITSMPRTLGQADRAVGREACTAPAEVLAGELRTRLQARRSPGRAPACRATRASSDVQRRGRDAAVGAQRDGDDRRSSTTCRPSRRCASRRGCRASRRSGGRGTTARRESRAGPSRRRDRRRR